MVLKNIEFNSVDSLKSSPKDCLSVSLWITKGLLITTEGRKKSFL